MLLQNKVAIPLLFVSRSGQLSNPHTPRVVSVQSTLLEATPALQTLCCGGQAIQDTLNLAIATHVPLLVHSADACGGLPAQLPEPGVLLCGVWGVSALHMHPVRHLPHAGRHSDRHMAGEP